MHLPALAITDTFVVGSESEMLSLVAEVGDVAIRTDLNKSFILCVSGASTLANWQELLTSVTVDQTIIDGSTNAVSGNAVFDGLAGKANLNGGNGFTGSQWFSDFTNHAKPVYLGTNSLSHGSLYSPVALGNINGHFAFASDTRPPVVISTELLTNLSLVKLIVPNNSGTIALLSDIPSPTEVDQTIVDGSISAVSGNAVFDGLALKANLASPDFTGIPTAPTATSGVSTTQIATTAFVRNEINTAAYSYVKILGDQSIYGTKKFIANTMFFGLMAENTAGGSASFYASTQNNHSAVFVQGLGSTGNVVAINANPLASGNLLYIDVGSNPNLNFILGRKNSADVFKIDNNAVVTATSFVKGNTATSNILLAGGGDIPQSAFLTSVSPTLTGTPTAPTATAGTNTDQIATTAFVQAAARPYKVYTALLSQTGTNAPTATVLENTLGVTITWTRMMSGQFLGTASYSIFSPNKFVSSSGRTNINTLIRLDYFSPTDVFLGTATVTGAASSTFSDSLITSASIEIRVYN